MSKLDWRQILEQAAVVVQSYDTGVTLRQLFYRLVARQPFPTPRQLTKLSAPGALKQGGQAGSPSYLTGRGRAIGTCSVISGPSGTSQDGDE